MLAVVNTIGEVIWGSSAHTSQGRRYDLINEMDEEDFGLPSRKELEGRALLFIYDDRNRGTTAGEFSEYQHISREWARNILLGLVDKKILKINNFKSFHLFTMVDGNNLQINPDGGD